MTDSSMPEWPSPLVGFSGYTTDDMTFLDRLKCCLLSFIVKPLSHVVIGNSVYQGIADYQKVMEGVSFTRDAGVSIPMIVTTVMGFEYPKTSHALTHYVGPILMSSPPPIDKEMSDWLNDKERKSVVYISMGTTAFITAEMATSLVDKVQCSVVTAQEQPKCFEGHYHGKEEIFHC